MRLQALRGAITCTEDSKAEIDAKTARLVKEIFAAQRAHAGRRREHLLHQRPPTSPPSSRPARRATRSASTTSRCSARRSRPCRTARRLCIRVLVHCYTERPRDELHHVFLEGAARAAGRPRRRRLIAAPWPTARSPSRSSAPGSSAARSGSRSGAPASTCAASTATPTHASAALDAGALDERRADLADAVAGADLTVVAVPVGHVADVVVEALDAGAAPGDRRRLGEGAGRRRGRGGAARARAALRRRSPDGRLGAGGPRRRDADLFVGATWVLTPDRRAPTRRCSPTVRSWVSGARRRGRSR